MVYFMNAGKSLFWWIIVIGIFVGVFFGFRHGAELTDTNGLQGALWMVGSVVVAVLTMYLSWRLRAKR